MMFYKLPKNLLRVLLTTFLKIIICLNSQALLTDIKIMIYNTRHFKKVENLPL